MVLFHSAMKGFRTKEQNSSSAKPPPSENGVTLGMKHLRGLGTQSPEGSFVWTALQCAPSHGMFRPFEAPQQCLREAIHYSFRLSDRMPERRN